MGSIGAHGGVGIWAWSTKDVVFRYCIAHNTRSVGGDGGGFDLDGGCVGCVIEHCLSFENDGPGYMHCDYPESPPTARNVMRDSVSINDGRKKGGENIGFGFVTWGSGLDDCVVERNQVFVSVAPDGKDRSPFFVTLIEGSKGAKDVLHVRNSVFRDNVAVVSVPGLVFASSNLTEQTLKDVRFEGNRANRDLPVVEKGTHFPNLDAWRKATGQESKKSPAKRSVGVTLIKAYRTLSPRDLPRFLGSASKG